MNATKSVRILFVDDDKMVCSTIKAVIESAGWKVTIASDGSQAVMLYQDRYFDVVITDLLMPEKGGIEMIQDLRRIDPGVAIIAISGGPERHLRLAQYVGAKRTLAKPFMPSELLAAIDETLQVGQS